MDLNKELPKGIITVKKPDHPFTYDGPDILLSDKNGLLALFTVRKNEQNGINKLLSRVTNSIIAYPSFTKMLLLIDNDIEISSSLLQFGKLYFKDILEAKDLKKSNLLLRDKPFVLQENGIKYLQKRIFSLQSQIQYDNLQYIEKTNFEFKNLIVDERLKDKAKYFSKLSQKDVTARANIFEYENQYFGIKKLSKSTPDMLELQPFYEFAINAEFEVDDGVPYLKHLSRKVLNLNDIPKSRFDPFKPIRIASLFGWHIANSNDFNYLEQRISKFKK